MKNTILLTTLITGAVFGLSGCGGGGNDSNGGGGSSTVSKFNGTWNGACEESTNSRSFKQVWKINGANLDNDISVWSQPSCPTGVTSTAVSSVATVEYQSEVTLADGICDGKAQEVSVTFVSITQGNTTITGEDNIRNVLVGQNIDNVLPKYNLVCIDATGKLRTGLITAENDGSTVAKRPTEMDPVFSLSP